MLQHLAESLEEVKNTVFHSPTAIKILKRLKKLIKTSVDEKERVHCPCCSQEVASQDVFAAYKAFFNKEMNEETTTLMDNSAVGDNAEKVEKFKAWIATVQEHVSGFKDAVRSAMELTKLEATIAESEAKIGSLQNSLDSSKCSHDESVRASKDLETVHSEVSELLKAATSVSDKSADAASRRKTIANYAPSSDGKSLRQVRGGRRKKGKGREKKAVRWAVIYYYCAAARHD